MDHARTFIAFFALLLLTLVPMSDSDLDLFPEEPDLRIDDRAEVASGSSCGPRRSSRLVHQGDSGAVQEVSLLSQLQVRGINPAPGLSLPQLRDLMDLVAGGAPVGEPPSELGSSAAAGRAAPSSGRKRTRKSGPPPAPPSKRGTAAPLAHSPARASSGVPGRSAADDSVGTALLSLSSVISSIDARLQSLENASATAASSGTVAAARAFTLQPAPSTSQPSTSFQAAGVPHTLASAVPAIPMGRPFIPSAANVSQRLRAKILQGRDINLVSIILPSPECDKTFASGENVSAILKSSDPRLNRDLSIGQFLVAFGIFRDVICSVYPDRRQELDAYLALIGDINLTYGKALFYQYHKAFSRKAALYVAQYNTRSDWSVLDTEVLMMVIGGAQAVTCNTCGGTGHASALCPTVPFMSSFPAPSAPGAQFSRRGGDMRGRKVQHVNNQPICINFNENVCSFPNCRYLHICSSCHDAHPRSVCPRRAIRVPARRENRRDSKAS